MISHKDTKRTGCHTANKSSCPEEVVTVDQYQNICLFDYFSRIGQGVAWCFRQREFLLICGRCQREDFGFDPLAF